MSVAPASRGGLRWIFVGWLLVTPNAAAAQMMGGGRQLQGGREAMSERLTDTNVDRRAYLESFREQDENAQFTLHRLTASGSFTRFNAGESELSETVGSFTYRYRRPGFSVRVAGGPLGFASGDTLSIKGLSPVQIEVGAALRPTDSLSLGLRLPSRPGSLDASQVTAIESLGTSTLDLSSIEFGTPVRISVGLTHAEAVGDGVTVSINAAADYEPEPSSERMSYWRGTTLRGELAISEGSGRVHPRGALTVTRSFSDSLGGVNLFQGGGTIVARVGLASLLGEGTNLLLDVSAFYYRPFAVTRQDSFSQRDPTGAFAGGTALIVWAVGSVYLSPSLVVAREASQRFVGRDEFNDRGWSVAPSIALDVPLAQGIAITPHVGITTGGTSTELIARVAGMVERFEVTDELSGWWGGATLSWSF